MDQVLEREDDRTHDDLCLRRKDVRDLRRRVDDLYDLVGDVVGDLLLNVRVLNRGREVRHEDVRVENLTGTPERDDGREQADREQDDQETCRVATGPVGSPRPTARLLRGRRRPWRRRLCLRSGLGVVLVHCRFLVPDVARLDTDKKETTRAPISQDSPGTGGTSAWPSPGLGDRGGDRLIVRSWPMRPVSRPRTKDIRGAGCRGGSRR